ncbi:MAG: hypothetical protein WDM76_14380 [Limisphaerales bacterium]
MKKLFEIIRCEVARQGILPFSRFMELALYHPEHGYYETDSNNVGRKWRFLHQCQHWQTVRARSWLFNSLNGSKNCELRIANCELSKPARMTANWPKTF